MIGRLVDFEYGGRRMCIANNGKYFTTATYGRFGITLYDTENGSALWTTKEVKRIQRIFSADDTKILAINNDNRLYTISTTDGNIISIEKGIEKIFPDSTLEIKLTSHGRLTWNEGSVSLTDKILSLCSSNGRVFCTIMGSGMKCFSNDESELWSVQNNPQEHCINLCYCPKFDCVIGFGFKFNSERTGLYHFWDMYFAESGAIIYSVGLNDKSQYTFIDNGEIIISGIGNVYTLEKDGFILNERQV